jgi:hypothetical protein
MRPSIVVGDDLALRFPGVEVRLTPREGFELAQTLVRKSFRSILIDEAGSEPIPSKAKRKAPR